jgi:hypothetical protein
LEHQERTLLPSFYFKSADINYFNMTYVIFEIHKAYILKWAFFSNGFEALPIKSSIYLWLVKCGSNSEGGKVRCGPKHFLCLRVKNDFLRGRSFYADALNVCENLDRGSALRWMVLPPLIKIQLRFRSTVISIRRWLKSSSPKLPTFRQSSRPKKSSVHLFYVKSSLVLSINVNFFRVFWDVAFHLKFWMPPFSPLDFALDACDHHFVLYGSLSSEPSVSLSERRWRSSLRSAEKMSSSTAQHT